jgi:hypothetical protein
MLTRGVTATSASPSVCHGGAYLDTFPRYAKWEYGQRPDLLAVTHVYDQLGSPGLIVAAKGAPAAIAKLSQLPEHDRVELHRALDTAAPSSF